jgi:hypothetical protein
MSSERKSVFVSCGQFSEDERSLGKRVAELVDECTPFVGYFAENQTTLETLTENVLRRLYESVGLIVIMHHRGTVETPTRTLTRASVWIEQEVAVATLMQQILKRPLHVALFVQRGIAIEGIRQQLQLNPMEFASGDEVIAKLLAILPGWKYPLYVGDEELRKMVESADLSICVDNGHHANLTIEIENHSKMDALVRSIVLWSKDSRVCRPVTPPEGVTWKIPAGRQLPIQFTAKENVAQMLANLYEQGPPVGNYPRTFRAELVVELRCELSGIERTIKENCKVQVELLNRQITGIR